MTVTDPLGREGAPVTARLDRRCWVPVATAAEVGAGAGAGADSPVLVRWCDEDVVVGRVGGELRAVVAGRDRRLRVAEHLGWIWVCDGRSVVALPSLPERDDPAFRVVAAPPYTWRANAARRIENFVDFAHFAWVHEGLLGSRDNPWVPDHDVERIGSELRFAATIVEPNDGEVKRQLDLPGDRLTIVNSYRLFPPYSIRLERQLPAGNRYVLFVSVLPRGARECTTFWYVCRNYALDEPDAGFLAFEDEILAADRPIVESQRPEALPADLTAELHLVHDRVAVEYRRLLTDLAEACHK